MPVIFLMFIVLPVVEMAVLIQVGSLIGVLYTIGLVLLTAVVGAVLLRQQGLATLLKANQRMNSGELPAREVAEGLILAVGGALLLTPGFVTDTIGFLCLIPGSRHWLAAQALRRMVVAGTSSGSGSGSRFHFQAGQRGRFGLQPGADDDIIEGEYRNRSSDPEDRDFIEKK
jgi:UPF0716 protein FxsA